MLPQVPNFVTIELIFRFELTWSQMKGCHLSYLQLKFQVIKLIFL